MIQLDLTYQDPVHNIAFDEALLEQAESASTHPEVLRFWESPEPMVVLGRSSPIQKEVNLEFCRQNSIPVIRRCSGGQTIVAGPGCLMYAVLLDYRQRPQLRMLDVAHRFVMEQMQAALARIGIETSINGTSDLTLGGQKVSGNSLRCRRNWMIYHGTMICDLEIGFIEKCLSDPIRKPEYRGDRGHQDFLRQIPVKSDRLRQAIASQWQAATGDLKLPAEKLAELLNEKYLTAAWNEKV